MEKPIHTTHFKPISFPHQKIIQWIDARIDLYETHFHYRIEFTSKEWKNPADETLGDEDRYTNSEIHCKRDRISAIQKTYCEREDIWKLSIIPFGVGADISVYFDTEAETNELHKQMLNYTFK